MKTILIGSVYTSRKILETMIEMNFPISYVFSLDESIPRMYPVIHQFMK